MFNLIYLILIDIEFFYGIMKFMLTKKDLQQVEEIVQRNITSAITSAFQDFYTNIFEPYANKNEREHGQIVKEMKSMKKEISGLHDETSEIKDFIKDHEKRITILEKATSAKN